MEQIRLRGVRTHNLKNIDLDLPRDRLIVLTGLSGSGKSSLAFDTLYAEGQRRYVESLSAYARQFLSLMEKPDVDHVEGLSPAISIEQKSTSHNPRSTVGTITEIHDYLRLLFARVGIACCPEHHRSLQAQTISQMTDLLLAMPEGRAVMLLAPLVRDRKGEHAHVFEQLRAQGFVRVRVDGIVVDLDDVPALDKQKKHSVEVVVDRLRIRPDSRVRLAESLETALKAAEGLVIVAPWQEDWPEQVFSSLQACPECGYSLAELEPRMFSFNNPAGACPACDGLGLRQFFDETKLIDPQLTLRQGAIALWGPTQGWYFGLLQSVCQHLGVDMALRFAQVPDAARRCILQGSGHELIDFSLTTERGTQIIKKQPFEGVIPALERRFRDTESAQVREDLARYMSQTRCQDCEGSRLRLESRHVYIEGQTLPEFSQLAIDQALACISALHLPGRRGEIAAKIIKEIQERLQFLVSVGLDYLSLDRSADTLSGGEAQRIRLASQIGAGLMGVMYVLDEPSIGLHQRDNERLLATLCRLRDLGNTVIVVEHDEEAIRLADHIVDMGPGAGIHGGQVVAQGTLAQILNTPESVTGQYLSGKKSIALPVQRRPAQWERKLVVKGATGHNLKQVDLELPLGLLICITGVSGSGKSTLINRTLYPQVARHLNGSCAIAAEPCLAVEGLQHLDKVIDIDQSPIGRTPRSNPATYTGIFTVIRELFAATQEARSRGYAAGRFSFNVAGGRCEACQGDGVVRVAMHFLPDMFVPCDVCHGLRYQRETLDIRYRGKNIAQVLAMTVEEALEFYNPIPALQRKLQTLMQVGLSYISLGQSATTLSGGEAQRIKLAKELSRRDTGKTLYLLDEPTTGLHFHDIAQLLTVLCRLREHGNTVVVIEHNLDVIKTADWIIDLGPEGGAGGGRVIATGTPEQIAQHPDSHTGRFLAPLLN